MIRDLQDYPSETVLYTDVCIVGTGPAGIALAQELIGTNLDVLLLESGGSRHEDESQALNNGSSIGLPHRTYLDGRARRFGGTGTIWAGQCLPMDTIDFERRDWIPDSGWPFSFDSIRPYFSRAEAFFKIQGERYDSNNYARFGIDPPAWDPAALKSMFTVYTAHIDIGKAWHAKISRAANVTVLLHANITQIETNDAGTICTSVRARSLRNTAARITAKSFVICCGAIENARLLLASNKVQKNGLGNRYDLVGRYFQEHPNAFTGEVETKDPFQLQQKLRLLYAKSGIKYFPKFRLSETRQRQERVANCNGSLLFEYPEGSGITALQETYRAARKGTLPTKPLRKLMSILRHSPEVAESLAQRFLSGRSPCGSPSRIRLQIYLEQTPNHSSRVRLSTRRDQFGVPDIEVDWMVTDMERRTLQVMTQTVRQEISRLGLGTITPSPWLNSEEWKTHLSDCAHHAGTTRMANTEQHGVVDSNCQVFGIRGLFICGGSVFPTSGYANPTLTIVAMAIRIADLLRAQLGATTPSIEAGHRYPEHSATRGAHSHPRPLVRATT